MNWMAWTWQTAVFFVAIGIGLIVMTVVELRYPTRLAKGFLPVPTTRGDRFFISLLSAAFIHLVGLALFSHLLWVATALAIVWAILVMARG